MKPGFAAEIDTKPLSSTAVVDAPNSDGASVEASIVIIDHRMLMRECLSGSLNSFAAGTRIAAFATVEQWQKEAVSHPAVALILLCIGSRRANASEVERNMTGLAQGHAAIPVVLVGDVEDPEQILDAIESGARGYIPTSASLNVAVEALRLIRVGGTYIPAASIIARRSSMSGSVDPRITPDMFTRQQKAVLRALRQGKANKMIAYELNVTEATVKVHMRGIMKKLRARNRTEVVCMVNEIFSGESRI